MSVLFETSLGDLVIDLEVESCPKTCENVVKLCKVYDNNLNAPFNGNCVYFSRIIQVRLVSKDLLAQIGDPSATGTGGESILSYIGSSSSSGYFPPEHVPRLKHSHRGAVSMAVVPALEGHKRGGVRGPVLRDAERQHRLPGREAHCVWACSRGH
jgi:peptidyl-prolyl cis-trans isomerase-like 4